VAAEVGQTLPRPTILELEARQSLRQAGVSKWLARSAPSSMAVQGCFLRGPPGGFITPPGGTVVDGSACFNRGVLLQSYREPLYRTPVLASK
jgi:hypothetical protein